MKIKSDIAWQILTQLNENMSLKDIEPICDIKGLKIPFYQAIFQLVETGCLEYTKLCYDNYYYWWYETQKGKEREAKKTNFTCNLDDFTITHKAKQLLKLKNLKYYTHNNKFYYIMSEYDRLESRIDRYETYIKYNEYLTEEYKNRCLEYVEELVYIYEYKDKNFLF